MQTNINIVIKPKQIITIFNILRDIGLNTSHRGTKYINKAVQILVTTDNDIIKAKDIYNSISNYYSNITPKQVKNDISYALNSRTEEKAKKNFEKVFGFEYDQYYFTNKIIIDSRLIFCCVNNIFIIFIIFAPQKVML